MMQPEIALKIKLSNRARRIAPRPLCAVPVGERPAASEPAATRVTVAPAEIRRWVEARGGRPAAVMPLLQCEEGEIGALRIEFPDRRQKDNLKEISWELFFKTFETRHLLFLYQERTAAGEQSRFNKFIKEEIFTHPGRMERAA